MRRLTIDATAGLPRPRWETVSTISLLLAATLAAALDAPTAYLVPLAAAAWILLAATIRRETSPRYRRR